MLISPAEETTKFVKAESQTQLFLVERLNIECQARYNYI
jgi:hypothetical protein